MRSTATAASDHHSHFKNKQNNTRIQEPTSPKVENSRTTPTKSKWQPPLHSPPPPQILHLPHPTRWRPRPATITSTTTGTTSKPTKSPPKAEDQKPPPLPPCAERLETLFDQERSLDQRRKDELPETKSITSGKPSSGESGIENLRPEWNFLRTQRVALRSAADSFVSARRKIDGSESAEAAIARRRCGGGGPKEAEIGWSNFDRKALLLRRRLQEMNVREMMPKDKEKVDTVEAVDRGHDHNHDDDDVADVVSVKQFHQSVSDVSNSSTTSATTLPEVEMLRRKMEIVSKGMLEKIEAYGTLLTTTATATANSSRTARTGRKGAIALISKTVKVAASSGPRHHQQREECWGKCREVVRRIVAEVNVETEQWGEMQEMLKQVREEMDDLHCSRDFWERCAIQSDQKLRSTNTKVMEWTQRARSSEQRASELQRQVMELRSEVEELKEERSVVVASFQKEKLRRTPSASSAQQRRRPLREICNLTTVDKMKTKTKTNKK